MVVGGNGRCQKQPDSILILLLLAYRGVVSLLKLISNCHCFFKIIIRKA